MKTVTLIVPPYPLLAEPTVYPPLGLLYIASILELHGYEVKVCDLRTSNDYSSIPKADVYGVSATTGEAEDTKKLGKYLKGKGFTIVGGAHASLCPTDIVDYFDAVIVGDGEESIIDVIENEQRGIIKGKTIKCLDLVPPPARHLMEKEKIVSPSLWGGYRSINVPPATTIMTSRSCPFKCAFCGNIPQPVRFHSPEYVAHEIIQIVKYYNCTYFDILDDHFTMNKNRLRKLVPFIKPLNISFRCQARGDALDDETCDLLVEMGCKEVDIGVETGDERLLTLLNKRVTIEQLKNAIAIAKAHNLDVKIFLMAGLPGETWESIEKTKRFIIETQPTKAPPTMFIPYPGCDIYDHPEKYGIKILTKDFSKYFMYYPTKSIIESDVASSEELTAHFLHLRDFVLSNQWRK